MIGNSLKKWFIGGKLGISKFTNQAILVYDDFTLRCIQIPLENIDKILMLCTSKQNFLFLLNDESNKRACLFSTSLQV